MNELIIKRPRITEKSGLQAEGTGSAEGFAVYTFEVMAGANKKSVAKAIKEIYKVTPIKVNITNLPAKLVFSRGKNGRKSGVKKAVVYLKKGDKIEFV